MIQVDKINYHGWENCYRLANDHVELVATTDVGPRIIRYGFINQGNMFKEYPEMIGKTGGDKWQIYGGHRFWHAPEHQSRTYYPDNHPVEFQAHGDFVRLIQPVETTTGIQKEIDLILAASSSEVTVIHRLRNKGLWSVELAPWALSVMNTGGVGIIPLPPKLSHNEQLLPTTTISVWGYTNMADPRWTWGQSYILLQQDTTASTPQKVGISHSLGWAAYAHENGLFVKYFPMRQPQTRYPDMDSSVELFTNPSMLEVETLGPLTLLQPNATLTHQERWYLFPPVLLPKTEEDVNRHILKAVLESYGS